MVFLLWLALWICAQAASRLVHISTGQKRWPQVPFSPTVDPCARHTRSLPGRRPPGAGSSAAPGGDGKLARLPGSCACRGSGGRTFWAGQGTSFRNWRWRDRRPGGQQDREHAATETRIVGERLEVPEPRLAPPGDVACASGTRQKRALRVSCKPQDGWRTFCNRTGAVGGSAGGVRRRSSRPRRSCDRPARSRSGCVGETAGEGQGARRACPRGKPRH